MHAISTDAVRYMLRRTVPRNVLAAELFTADKELLINGELDTVLQHQNAESRALWPYLLEIMHSYDLDGYDVLLEGVAVLPELVRQLEMPSKAIIIGNNDSEHAERVLQLAGQNTHDWLHTYSPAQAQASVAFFAHMNDWLKSDAEQHKLAFCELSDNDFYTDLERAAKTLLS